MNRQNNGYSIFRNVLISSLALVLTSLLASCSAESTADPVTTVTHIPSTTVEESPKTTATTTPLSTINPNQSLAPIDGTQGEGNTPKRTKVDWSQLPEGLEAQIDADTAAANCKSIDFLLNEYSSNAQLTKYLTEAITLANC